MKLFENGQVFQSGELKPTDLLVDEWGLISDIAETGSLASRYPDAQKVDCKGQWLLPAGFDLHVRGMVPGYEHKETIPSLLAAMTNGGWGGMLLMPTGASPIDSGGAVSRLQEALTAAGAGDDVLIAGALTRGLAGEELSSLAGMVSQGVKVVTQVDAAVADAGVLRVAMKYASDFGLLVALQSDTPALSARGVINEGATSYKLGLPGSPAIAQEIGLERDLLLARDTGCRFHAQQVSTARMVDSIRRAKSGGAAVTCDVSIHHLLLTETAVGDYNTACKLSPPLRLEEDRAALIQALADGTIDCVTSSHAPHTEFEKAAPFAEAPFGASALDIALLVGLEKLVQTGEIPLERWLDATAGRPRAILGLPSAELKVGAEARFTIYEPETVGRIDRQAFASKGASSPFLGDTVKGKFLS